MDIFTIALLKKYVIETVSNIETVVAGKSAYEIAVDNGFSGTPAEWLASLHGSTPEIGPNGTWVINGNDTGIVASPSLAGYATEDYVNQQVENKVTRDELNAAILGIVIPDVSNFATKEEVEQAVNSIPMPDLTSYATKQEVEDAIGNIDLTNYATKQDVSDAINAIPEVNLEGLATESFVKDEIGKIEIPGTPDLTPYALKSDIPDTSSFATEDYVIQKIAEAELAEGEVDLSAYYTKTEVDEKFNNIEHPTVDLSDYAKKEDLPSLEGLASEEYVNEAIAAIAIPEAKADINVYEINSDSSIIDELVILLPEGIEIHQGDVMIVTNSLGVKSAYQFDENWIACDGNVDASKVIMPFDITLAGSYEQVGNLSKSKTGTGTFATKGKSVAAALQEILSKREQPKITSNPSVSLTATNGAKEVGTSITPTWSAKLNAGSYTYGPATGITAASWAISDTDGNAASEASGSFPSIIVGDDTKYRISAKATYNDGAVAVDNLGDPSNPTVQITASSKSANGGYITGYRAWFMYVGEALDTINSGFIRSTINKGSTPSSQSGIEIPSGTKRVMVAIPATSDLELTSVIDVDGMGLDVFGNFAKSNIDVEGLNGYKAASYNVWVAENENGMAATHYNLIIS